MSVFGKYKLDESQVKEILEQLRNSKAEMENCLSDYAVTCYELFRVQESQNVQLLYWVRIVRLDNDNYELQFIREVQFT